MTSLSYCLQDHAEWRYKLTIYELWVSGKENEEFLI